VRVSAVAHAHPNIALIKYWGKAPQPGNVPAMPSLSITLDTLTTTTVIAESNKDVFQLNGRAVDDPKIAACLANLRRCYDIPPLAVDSHNNFPTAAGLASSASGFAALVTAVDTAFDLSMTPAQRSELARQASASAARSVFGGFVTLQGPEWQGQLLLEAAAWPLRVVVAVTDSASKDVSSSTGMRQSAATSPYYPAWVESAHRDFQSALGAVDARNFAALAELAEHSCLKMHGLMLSTRPGLLYWNATTLACLHRVRALRAGGESVFFTVDAGPQVKAVCLPASEAAVKEALSTVPGVTQILAAGLGPGAWAEAR
jgi:diphosphomevalonate decarboxylase